MQRSSPAFCTPAPISSLLLSVPAYAVIADMANVACTVWRDPEILAFNGALANGSLEVVGLRAILTDASLFLWQSTSVLHGAMAARLGFDGVRVRLQSGRVLVNQEACALPEFLPWVFASAPDLDIEARRILLVRWMHRFRPLLALYSSGFEVDWYM